MLHVEVYSQSQSQCPDPMGTNDEIQFTDVRNERFYLNTENPAPCSGTINQLRYCYYRPTEVANNSDSNSTRGDRYFVTVAAYRRMRNNNGSVLYEKVSNMSATIARRRFEVNFGREFECFSQTLVLDDGSGFDVEKGDVVGVCIVDPPDTNRFHRRQLDVVGEASGYSLMQMNDVSGCDHTMIPSSVLGSQLSIVNSTILHVYANITSMPTKIISR